MLVLSRKVGEKIILPEQNITITVCEIRDGRVRLGIAAPKDMPIHRGEHLMRDTQVAAPQPVPAE